MLGYINSYLIIYANFFQQTVQQPFQPRLRPPNSAPETSIKPAPSAWIVFPVQCCQTQARNGQIQNSSEINKQMIWHEAPLEVTPGKPKIEDIDNNSVQKSKQDIKFRERHMAQPGGAHLLTLSDLEVSERNKSSWLWNQTKTILIS